MKLFISLMLLVTICSCSSSINPKGFAFAEKLCKNNGGLHEIEINQLMSNTIRCNNGAHFDISGFGVFCGDKTHKTDLQPFKDTCNDVTPNPDLKKIDEDVKRTNEETLMLMNNQPKNLYPGDEK